MRGDVGTADRGQRGHSGAHEEGLDQLDQALSVFEATDSFLWQARTLEMLGDSVRERTSETDNPADSAGPSDAARDFYQRALALYARLSPDDAARLRSRLERLEGGAPGS
ncbi:hypothetical protein AB0I22_08225 [Streptomyces sp. NPDC050610]|uniref:hypothetical protein n=1 Tax=Streptomyces sp. NPDC050610 TaxID=3157097 RepID=UPI00341EA31C